MQRLLQLAIAVAELHHVRTEDGGLPGVLLLQHLAGRVGRRRPDVDRVHVGSAVLQRQLRQNPDHGSNGVKLAQLAAVLGETCRYVDMPAKTS